MEAKDRIIVAIDVHDKKRLLELVTELKPHVGLFKFGLESLMTFGAHELDAMMTERGIRSFNDPKLHDTPATIAAASRQVAGSNVEFFTVHAAAGLEGMRAAVKNKGPSKVLAVTVLTSHDEEEAEQIYSEKLRRTVAKFARSAFKAGVDGLICSPHELGMIRASSAYGRFTLVTPAIRPEWYGPQGQKRHATPAFAVRNGADYLVIGQPILNPPPEIGSPADAAKRIAAEIAEALAA